MASQYKTRDIYLASFLVMNGIALAGLEKNDKRFSFLFEDSPKVKELTDLFYSRNARVEPMAYSMSMKQVKSQMYNQV